MQLKVSSLKLRIPSWTTAVGSGILAVIGGFNVATFNLPAPWSQLVTFGCASAAGIGLGPLTHAKLRSTLHLSMPTALTIAGAATTACAGITTLAGVDQTLKGVLVGVLTGIAGLLVAPDASPSDPAPVLPPPIVSAPVAPPTPAPTPPAPAPTKPVPARPRAPRARSTKKK